MTINSLSGLFLQTLRENHYNGDQLRRRLPRMILMTNDSQLRGVLEDHLDQITIHIDRLAEVFASIGAEVESETSPAITGILFGAEDLIASIDHQTTRDIALIGYARAIAEYEVSRYITLCDWAERLGYSSALAILEQSQLDEKAVGNKLCQIAGHLHESLSCPGAIRNGISSAHRTPFQHDNS